MTRWRLLVRDIKTTRDGVISFNTLPAPLPWPYVDHTFREEMGVELRADAGMDNADLIDTIGEAMGFGPFIIETLGVRKHLVRNKDGKHAWIPSTFLVPAP